MWNVLLFSAVFFLTYQQGKGQASVCDDENLLNGRLQCTLPPSPIKYCIATCNDGYEIVGKPNLQCASNMWDERPTCQALPNNTCSSTSVTLEFSQTELAEIGLTDMDKLIVSKELRDNSTGLSANCIATKANPKFNFGYTDCASYVSIGDHEICFTYLIRNLLYLNQSIPIRRSNNVCFNRTCCLNYTALLTSSVLHPKLEKSLVGTIITTGNFDLGFKLCKDVNCTTLINNECVVVPDFVFAQISLLHTTSNPNLFNIQVQHCWATPTNNSEDTVRYDIISNGCSRNESWNGTDVIQITHNAQSIYSTFQFLSFVWTNSSSTHSYLHCRVKICYNDSTGCSPLNCTAARRRRRRDVDAKEDVRVLSVGPMNLDTVQPDASCDQNNGGCSDQCFSNTGKVVCECRSGRYLTQDKKTCLDIIVIPEKVEKVVEVVETTESNIPAVIAVTILAFAILLAVILFLRVSKFKQPPKSKEGSMCKITT